MRKDESFLLAPVALSSNRPFSSERLQTWGKCGYVFGGSLYTRKPLLGSCLVLSSFTVRIIL